MVNTAANVSRATTLLWFYKTVNAAATQEEKAQKVQHILIREYYLHIIKNSKTTHNLFQAKYKKQVSKTMGHKRRLIWRIEVKT